MTVRFRRLVVVIALGGMASYSLLTAAEQPMPTRPVTIVASPAIVPKGSVCRVELVAKKTGSRSTSCTIYIGAILEATDDGVRVAVSTEEYEGRNEGLSTGLPFIDRLYKSSGVVRVEPEAGKEVWVTSREIASITLVELPQPHEEATAPAE